MWVYQERKEYTATGWKGLGIFDVGFYIRTFQRSDFVVVETFDTKELARNAAHFLNGGS